MAEERIKGKSKQLLKQNVEPIEIWAAIRPSFFCELEKVFPKAWHELELYRFYMHHGITRNLEWGKQEGLARTNINTTFVAELCLHQLTNFFPRSFVSTQQWSIHQSLMELTSLYLHSITIEKGRNRLCTSSQNYH